MWEKGGGGTHTTGTGHALSQGGHLHRVPLGDAAQLRVMEGPDAGQLQGLQQTNATQGTNM
jgi:hypothetical protein